MKQLLLSFLLLSASVLAVAQPKVIAHRGHWNTPGSAQNSIISLYKAHEIGCYGCEFDVWLTADKNLIVYHDDKVNGLYIPDTPYDKLRDIQLSTGEVIPSLEQYLVHAQNCPDIKLILELKTCRPADIPVMVEKVLALVDKYKLQSRTEYIAFSLDICKEIVRVRPRAEVAYLSGNLSPEELQKAGLGMDYHFSAFDKNLDWVNQAHARGVNVNVWTVNDAVRMKRLVGMGVDYITTDNPELCREMIKDYTKKYTQIEKPQVDLSKYKKDKKGFITLFDGTSLDGWRGYCLDQVADKWVIEDGALKFDSKKAGKGGEIIFGHRFKNFELELEWKIAEAGNSGIFYLIQEIPGQYAAASAPEAQVLDNANHPDAKLGKDGNRQATSLYDLIAAKPQNAKPHGKWNKVKIRVDNGKVTHYQNGKKVVEYTIWTPEWIAMLENSKFKVTEWEDAYYLMTNCGGINREGYIGFQDHGDDVWFRNIRVKVLD